MLRSGIRFSGCLRWIIRLGEEPKKLQKKTEKKRVRNLTNKVNKYISTVKVNIVKRRTLNNMSAEKSLLKLKK